MCTKAAGSFTAQRCILTAWQLLHKAISAHILSSRATGGTAYRQCATVPVHFRLFQFATMLFAVAKPEPEPGGTRGHLASPMSSKRHAALEHPPEVSTPISKKAKAHKAEQGRIENFFGRKK